jgi:hypothetical protein
MLPLQHRRRIIANKIGAIMLPGLRGKDIASLSGGSNRQPHFLELHLGGNGVAFQPQSFAQGGHPDGVLVRKLALR